MCMVGEKENAREGKKRWKGGGMSGGGFIGSGIESVIYNIPITSVTVASEATRMHLVATF